MRQGHRGTQVGELNLEPQCVLGAVIQGSQPHPPVFGLTGSSNLVWRAPIPKGLPYNTAESAVARDFRVQDSQRRSQIKR